MAWSASAIFAKTVESLANRSNGALNLGSDSLKASLFDNTITPDKTVTAANSAYGAGVWASGGVSDASGWPAAGRALASVTSTATSNVYTLSAANTASANSTTTLTNAYGVLVYDHTAATTVDQGISYNYLGGANSVTSGTFTVVWSGSGIATITV